MPVLQMCHSHKCVIAFALALARVINYAPRVMPELLHHILATLESSFLFILRAK